MASRLSYKIDQRLLQKDFHFSEKVFKYEADRIIRADYFDPAVQEMINDFETHLVSEEIKAGVHSDNITGSLEGDFHNTKGRGWDDSPPNLYSFIGFDATEGDPLAPIRRRLDPTHRSGPKLIYRGKDKQRLTFTYEIRAPSEQAIYNNTPMPWAKGTVSWAKRIEQGIPGIGYYLNVFGRKGSRSGGGIQIPNKLPNRIRFRPMSYLSGIFRDFIRRASGGR